MESPLPVMRKLRLALRVWRWFVFVRVRVSRQPLPTLVEALARTNRGRPGHSPARLARAVDRSLRVGGRRPTCLVNALVLFRLLREEGEPAELVIGLPDRPSDQFAHAWVEIDGRDVGPPPGRDSHEPLARFG